MISWPTCVALKRETYLPNTDSIRWQTNSKAEVGMIDWQPVILSVKVAFLSLLFVAVLGTAFAHIMCQRDFTGKAAVEAIFALPLVLPPVVTGFVLLVLIGKQGPVGQFL